MPASIEINHPHPGDIVGGAVEVNVSWDLDLGAVPPNTDGQVECLDADGAEIDDNGAPVTAQPFAVATVTGSASVTFTFAESHDNIQFKASLRINGIVNAATDTSEGIEVEMSALVAAGATITIA